MKNICICGGGSLGHTVAGFIAAQNNYNVSVLTSRPEKWEKTLRIYTPDNEVLIADLSNVSNAAAVVIPTADVVLLCVPGFGIEDVLRQIKPYLNESQYVGSIVSSTGFFFQALEILPKNILLFGFQRVPFIARTIEYGKSAKIKGFKKELFLAIENATDYKKQIFTNYIQDLFKTQIKLLNSHFEASLTNSNPLLHTSRLFSMWKDWKPGIRYDSCPLFYAEWTIEAAKLYIEMDKEFQVLLSMLPVEPGSIPNVLNYYESNDAISLCNKLKTIPAFQGIYSPMLGNDAEGYVPDFKSRYFTEDFPYSLSYIVKLAHKLKCPTPNIDKVYVWGLKMIGENNKLNTKSP